PGLWWEVIVILLFLLKIRDLILVLKYSPTSPKTAVHS
ncbi:MAG: hypothetical protein ACI90V_008157, partial [Bacillariaceae sp.]